GEINRLAVLLNGHLAHAGTYERLAAKPFDQSAYLRGIAAFERGNAEFGEIGLFLGHVCDANSERRLTTVVSYGLSKPTGRHLRVRRQFSTSTERNSLT